MYLFGLQNTPINQLLANMIAIFSFSNYSIKSPSNNTEEQSARTLYLQPICINNESIEFEECRKKECLKQTIPEENHSAAPQLAFAGPLLRIVVAMPLLAPSISEPRYREGTTQ